MVKRAVRSYWVKEYLRNIDEDPPERVERYRMLFEKYLKEAVEHKKKGDTQQAAEKLWGAITGSGLYLVIPSFLFPRSVGFHSSLRGRSPGTHTRAHPR